MSDLFQSYSSYLGSSSVFKHSRFLMVCEIREYILPLADEIFKTLYAYRSVDNLISSYIN